MKRPKVRYVCRMVDDDCWRIRADKDRRGNKWWLAEAGSRGTAERIAAALNLHEAVRRGEIKVVEP